MEIYIVEQGDTLASISDKYQISIKRLISENGLNEARMLIPGQALVIAYPTKVYIVKEGDTLSGITQQLQITMKQLFRNNPYLLERSYIYPGEEIIISYGDNQRKITTNGYTNYYIDDKTLNTTLLYLTYLSVFGNRNSYGGEILTIDDSRVVAAAGEYEVVPIMMLSTMNPEGRGSLEVSYSLLSNEAIQGDNIKNMLAVLTEKGYGGVNVTFQFINSINTELYEKYTKNATKELQQEGFLVFVTISEMILIDADRVTFEKVPFDNIGAMVDGMTLLNYNWGYSFGPPGPVMSVYMIRKFLDYVITMVPAERIEIGIPIIGYDWELPYIIGVTKASSLTLDSALTLAGDVGATIQFDEVSQTPYFTYTESRDGIPIRHIVWFIDARSINAVMELIQEYGFRGVGIWNIMNYYAQLWIILNSQYEIESLHPPGN